MRPESVNPKARPRALNRTLQVCIAGTPWLCPRLGKNFSQPLSKRTFVLAWCKTAVYVKERTEKQLNTNSLTLNSLPQAPSALHSRC